ncbi:hypothetical protein POSPLADRAFT_1154777, partial [Postia placenta MAD-698-R-SB12]
GNCDSGPLSPNLDSGKLGEDGSGPGSHVTIEEAEGNLDLQLDGGEGRIDCPVNEQLGDEVVAFDNRASTSPYQGRRREKTLLATRGTKDCLRTKATVVTVHRANFARNECLGGLAAVTAMEMVEKVRRRGDVGQGLNWPKNVAECHGARSWEALPTAAPKRAGGSLERSLEAVRLPQFFEGDRGLLMLDLYWRQVGECGARLSVAVEEEGAGVVEVCNINVIFCVKCVLKSHAVEGFFSHDGWREEGELTPTAPEVTLGFAIHMGPSTAFG